MRHLALVLFLATVPLQTKIDRIPDYDIENTYDHGHPALEATHAALKKGRNADDVVRRVAQQLAISEKAARPLVEGLLSENDDAD